MNEKQIFTADTSNSLFLYLFSALVMGYIFLYEPFFVVGLVDTSLRIVIESVILFIIFLIWVAKQKPGFIPTSFILIAILLAWLAFSESTSAPGLITKFIFLIFGIQVFRKYPKLVTIQTRLWIVFWYFTAIQALLAALGQYAHLLHFSVFEALGVDSSTRYFNPVFGFSLNRDYFGFIFAKVSGYLIEPQYFGFYCGLNVLAARYFLPAHKAKRFRDLNLIAGFFSGSISFYFFFISLGMFNLLSKSSIQKLREKKGYFLIFMIVGGLVASALLFWFGVDQYSSLGDRMFRLSIGVNAITHANPYSLLFGDFNYMQTVGADRGIANGLFSVLVQRGLIPFIILIYLLYKCSARDYLVMAYLFYAAMFMEYFWWPAFVVYLIIFYCLSIETQPISHSKASFDKNFLPLTAVKSL